MPASDCKTGVNAGRPWLCTGLVTDKLQQYAPIRRPKGMCSFSMTIAAWQPVVPTCQGIVCVQGSRHTNTLLRVHSCTTHSPMSAALLILAGFILLDFLEGRTVFTAWTSFYCKASHLSSKPVALADDSALEGKESLPVTSYWVSVELLARLRVRAV